MKNKENIGLKRIVDIVDENYVHGSVLYYFGIKFYDYSAQTLSQVCEEKGLKLEQVISGLESVTHREDEQTRSLHAMPVDLIIEYLKHKHFVFIKQELPYIARLIQNLDIRVVAKYPIVGDLKFVFPLFVEDFIHHIFEEEDTLFHYINRLNDVTQGKLMATKLYYDLERLSIQKFAMEHDVHDDEMQGIRKITHNYSLEKIDNLHLRVVYSELSAFEKKLQIHARVENEILFPKALMLERQVRKILSEKTSLN